MPYLSRWLCLREPWMPYANDGDNHVMVVTAFSMVSEPVADDGLCRD